MAKPKTHIRKDDSKTGKFRRGPPADAVRALHPARATGQRQSVVPEMPPVPQEGPLTRVQERRTRAVDTFFLPAKPQSGLERF